MSEQRDIIYRLRDRDAIVMSGLFHATPAMNEAADEIERLRAQLASARKALEETDKYLALFGYSETMKARRMLRSALADENGK